MFAEIRELKARWSEVQAKITAADEKFGLR